MLNKIVYAFYTDSAIREMLSRANTESCLELIDAVGISKKLKVDRAFYGYSVPERNTIYEECVLERRMDLVEECLRRGANVNLVRPWYLLDGRVVGTPLTYYVWLHKYDAVLTLLKYQPDVSIRCDLYHFALGLTKYLMYYASQSGSVVPESELMFAGDRAISDSSFRKEHRLDLIYGCLRQMLDRGGSPNQLDYSDYRGQQGQTLVDTFEYLGSVPELNEFLVDWNRCMGDCAELLRSYGGRPGNGYYCGIESDAVEGKPLCKRRFDSEFFFYRQEFDPDSLDLSPLEHYDVLCDPSSYANYSEKVWCRFQLALRPISAEVDV
ncbi:hypothetical protein [Ferrimonas marina]|uniref:Uncharacterized protein n=1 Tax=Ferrimonas marina TaxID=299255 RepID=A0A1M5TQR7_9GAMM|nr:hypothetical protein [Ferrimonas marina]SHH53039.1 hypothetical protein SAMN02745129_2240 [Ferrimonas marina]